MKQIKFAGMMLALAVFISFIIAFISLSPASQKNNDLNKTFELFNYGCQREDGSGFGVSFLTRNQLEYILIRNQYNIPDSCSVGIAKVNSTEYETLTGISAWKTESDLPSGEWLR